MKRIHPLLSIALAPLGALAAAALLMAAVLAPGNGMAASNAPPITVFFDHLATGFELDGVHRDLPCESCHLNAVFKGTPKSCGTCHIAGSIYNATPKTTSHMQTTNSCAACHNTTTFRPAIFVDHNQVLGTCTSCHNGTTAQGEGPTHPATSQNCESCHTVISWNPPKAVDHTQIPMAMSGFCIICHNGTQAAGKPTNHIATNLECGDCHLTKNWMGANFDHTGIVSGCVSCHNGTKAVGKQASHMPTSNVCEACHTSGLGSKSPNWAPSKFDHTQMSVATCATCHNGSVKITTGFVSGQPVNHVPPIPSTIDCGVCHGNNPSAETWAVLAASIPTLHSGLPVSNCLLCHAGQTFAGVPAPYVPMSISGVSPTKKTPLAPSHIPILAGTDCSACHGAAYQAGGFGPATAMSAPKHAFVSSTCDTCHDTGKSFYVGSGTALQLRPANHVSSADPRMASGDCSLCHTTTNWVSNTLPAGHMPNPSNLACVTCHASAPSDYTPATLAANSVLHTGISNNCGQCHGNTVTALTWFNNFTPKDAILSPAHIPYNSGSDCSSCHSSSTYAAGTFGPTNMTQARHAFVPTTCNTCHELTASGPFYMGAASPALQGRPADHAVGQMVAPNDCSLCHTTANWNSNVMPTGHMPNPANQGCNVCHTAAPANYATLASNAVMHTGISGNCGQCHGTPSGALTFYNNNDNPIAAVLSPAHIPYLSGTDCSSCHSSSTYAVGSFGPMNMTQAKHAFVPTACDTCHEAGMTFYMGAASPALQGRPADHTTGTQLTGDCSGCHNTANWTSTVMPPGHMPNTGNQACSVCHTAAGVTPPNYATMASISVLHTGISGSCGQCHGTPSGALTFYNNNDNPIWAGSPGAHIPYSNGVDCSSCHTTNYIVGGFGPMNMTAATHAYVPTTCNTCHDIGKSFYLGSSTNPLTTRPNSGPYDHVNSPSIPQMTAGDCSSCHNTSSWVATALPGGHMPNPANQPCTTCHLGAPTTYKTFATTAVLHTGITSGCAQCHGGTSQLSFYNNDMTVKAAASLSPAHIPAFAGEDCSTCHKANYVTGGFGPMNMTQATHSGVGSTCNGCHDAALSGPFYMGAASPALQVRPTDHSTGNMVSPNDCSLCHTTANWNSTVLPAGHMPNPANQTCSVCHAGAPSNYKTFASNAAIHTGVSSGCAQCHGMSTQLSFFNNDMVIKDAVLSPSHIPVLAGTDCSSCHASSTYAVGGFGPMNMTQATHTFVSTTCTTCHETGVSVYMGAASPGLQGRPADHTAGQMVAPNDCSLCHTTATWNSNVMPAGHMPNPANTACNVCHLGAPTNYKTPFAANSVLHTGITGNCSQCHGPTQLSFYNNDMVVKSAVLSPVHIPFISGTDCSSCHSSSSYAAGTFGPMNMTQAKHSFVQTSCDTCHEAGLSFYMGAASPALQGRPPDHNAGTMMAPNDCKGCHTTANWNSTVLPAGHIPNPANQACTVCHTQAPTAYTPATLAANAVLHTGISSGCITCHGAPNAAPPVFYLNYTPKDAVLSPVHIPTANTPCEDCHTATVFTAFSGTTMSSSKHTLMFTYSGKTCDQCHDLSTLKFYGVSNLTTRPSGHHVGQDCSGCHNTNNWDGGAAKRKVAATPATKSSVITVVSPPATTTASSISRVAAASAGTTQSTLAAMPSHAGVTTNCASCHNGILAPGKGVAHIASNNSCQNCHTTLAWLPAHFDHQGVSASCASCHNGVLAPGKPSSHVLTAQDCSACHGTISWSKAIFSHLGLNATCQSCHNGITATGKQIQHVATKQDCGSCHSTLTWTVTAPPPPRLRPLIQSPRGAATGSTK